MKTLVKLLLIGCGGFTLYKIFSSKNTQSASPALPLLPVVPYPINPSPSSVLASGTKVYLGKDTLGRYFWLSGFDYPDNYIFFIYIHPDEWKIGEIHTLPYVMANMDITKTVTARVTSLSVFPSTLTEGIVV